MEQLTQAATLGDINALKETIRRNPGVLRQLYETIWFVDTPLHVAASEGKILFAREMMRLMSSYARTLNGKGFSPFQSAVMGGQTTAAVQLTNGCTDLIRHAGKEGFTPLHCAAQTGNVELLGTFLSASPESMEDVTVGGETALMVSLKNEKIEAFEFLVMWIVLGYDKTRQWKKKIVCFEDDKGQTVVQRYRARPSHRSQVLGLLESVSNDYRTCLEILVDSSGNYSPFHIVDPYIRYLRTDQKLMLAAYDGDNNGFYSAISEDPHLLERIDNIPFVDTPLHITASMGKTHLALEIMRHKPSFARKMNPEGYSPLHLAIRNNKFDTMLRLVDVDNDLVHVKGKEGKTPLHCTVENGTRDAIARLLAACPSSILDLTDRKETVVHFAVKMDRVEALKVLCGYLVRMDNKKILTWTDDEGKNFWSIAETRNNNEVMKSLSEFGLTTKQPRVFRRHPFDRETDLNNPEARATSIYSGKSLADYLSSKISKMEELVCRVYAMQLTTRPENRDRFLVVFVLFATATYQAMLSPPGGVWQGDPTLRFPASGNSTNSTKSDASRALSLVGETVMNGPWRQAFFVCNTLLFYLSTILINFTLRVAFFGLPGLLMVCYIISSQVIGYSSFGWMTFMNGWLVLTLLVYMLMLYYLNWVGTVWRRLHWGQ